MEGFVQVLRQVKTFLLFVTMRSPLDFKFEFGLRRSIPEGETGSRLPTIDRPSKPVY